MAGASAERQENGVIQKIKEAVKKNKGHPITLKAGKTTLEGVVGAEKYTGRQTGGSEPYTDVVIYVKKGAKIVEINCSLKGESAPSLAGGGLKGLELAVPGIAKKFMLAAYKALKTEKKLKIGLESQYLWKKLQYNRWNVCKRLYTCNGFGRRSRCDVKR